MKKAKKQSSRLWLAEGQLAALRMDAINVAARLPEPRTATHGMAVYQEEPGKSAEKVVADAETIMAFVLKP
jgi:hypothetical protein